MLNFEREIAELRDAGAIAPELAATIIARERREVFSIHSELRILGWLGATLSAAGVGILIARNLDRIGPLALAIAIAVAALACYAVSWWRRRTKRASLIDESLVLLGGLLLSADVGYIEAQFHLLDARWQRHFLLLAVLHAIAAYAFQSRSLLTLSLGALAAYLGLEKVPIILISSTAMSVRAFICAAVVLLWSLVPSRQAAHFEPVFHHFAANLALAGALNLTFLGTTRILGVVLTLLFAAIVIWWGFRKHAESFAIYSYIYAVIAVDVLVCDLLDNETLIALYLIMSTIAAIAGLFVLHGRLRKAEA